MLRRIAFFKFIFIINKNFFFGYEKGNFKWWHEKNALPSYSLYWEMSSQYIVQLQLTLSQTSLPIPCLGYSDISNQIYNLLMK